MSEPMPTRYRTIWISDVHLGLRACKAARLLDFLRHNDSDYLYLVGDIVDGWQLKRSWFWEQRHNDVIQKPLRKARKGTRVIYIPGNHDEFAREFTGLDFGGIAVRPMAVHQTADGRRLLVMHGDEFDGVIHHARWLAVLGGWAYDVVLNFTYWVNRIRRKWGGAEWSLSAYLKTKVKNIVQFISRYEQALIQEVSKYGLDGIVCGHIHHADLRNVTGLLYANTGDWVESCTALVEHYDGSLEVIEWTSDREYRREDIMPVYEPAEIEELLVGAEIP